MMQRMMRGAGLAAVLLASTTAWAQTELTGGATESKSETVTIQIQRYGEIVLPDTSMDITVNATQLAGGTNTTVMNDELFFFAAANADFDIAVPATIELNNPSEPGAATAPTGGGTKLTAQCELVRFSQVDDTSPVPGDDGYASLSPSLAAVPSGDNTMLLRLYVNPALAPNVPYTTGVWSVLLPSGAYTNTTDLIITMTSN